MPTRHQLREESERGRTLWFECQAKIEAITYTVSHEGRMPLRASVLKVSPVQESFKGETGYV